MSLSEINEQDIILIENYAAENCRHLIDLDIENGVFKFKPGHRKVVLNLSKKVNEFLKEKASEKNSKVPNNEREEIELLSPEEIDKLKENLIFKLNTSARSFNLSITFTKEEIGEICPYISHSRLAGKKTIV